MTTKEIISTYSDEELRRSTTSMLRALGVPAHIKGYNYLRESIILAIKDQGLTNAITKRLYPQVARIFQSTSSRVERSMRHAIEVGWNRGDMDVQSEIFGSTIDGRRGKPTNSEFIALISDTLILDLERSTRRKDR